jgi:hypothetical protein
MYDPDAAPPPPSGGGGRQGNPWENREELGFLQGLIEGVKAFVTAPGATFSETFKSGDMASPLIFAVILSTAMALVGQIWAMMFGASLLAALPIPPEAEGMLGMLAVGSGFSIISVFIITPIFTAIGVFIGGAILHLMLMMVGGLNSSDAGFEGSMRTVAYGSSVGQLAQIVPIIGGLVSMVWTVTLLVIGAMRLHDTTQGKAITAVLLPVVLCCVCMMVLFSFGAFAAIMGANSGF